ncbi:putative type III secretion protein [Bordetella bronchiseptica Bbr77]|uniref:SctC family type III secretion system outer membrane ring subunit BscC n=1 Tax=Bordetella bronchiseptica TaxID=518 RepID=UPI00028F87B1|nr:SctC family type III secretion system outer membrane ring subunit BscC [Bordetella bronchiseptica]CCN04998.1 putative type III secretion protein [Bordetella bronchiseptica Bbr77]
MAIGRLGYLVRGAWAGGVMLLAAGSAWAAPNWPLAPYSYYAQQQSLSDVLREFAAGFSLALQQGKGVQGVVNGRFNAHTPTEFIERLSGIYGFNWFVHAGTLYVSRTSDVVTRAVDAAGASPSALRQALLQLGILDERFGWGELPAQGVAMVSGPPAYVALVEQAVAALPKGAGNQQVAVFRLKHASVSDRVIRYRDQQVVTPGMATMLRQLILGAGPGNDAALAAVAAPLRENPPVFGDAAADGKAPLVGAAQAAGRRLSEPSVQADTRLNALIVQDIPERMPIYRALIEQLDVPSTLIEIEAMIVDVNTDLVNELGVTWGAQIGTTSLGYGDLGLRPGNGLPVDGAAADLAPGTLGISVSTRLAARLRALESDGQANILSQPSILTADNLGAMIDLSDTFYIRTLGERVATVTPVTVGTSLRVTPRYIAARGGRQVELAIDIEDGRVLQEYPIDGLPRVRKSSISTLAVVGDEQTLLIGGYNNRRDEEQVEKVPLLGDIPGLGFLFSSKSRAVQRRERLFLIRPRVVAIEGKPVFSPVAGTSQVFMSTGWGGHGSSLSIAPGEGGHTQVRHDARAGRPVRLVPDSLHVEYGEAGEASP